MDNNAWRRTMKEIERLKKQQRRDKVAAEIRAATLKDVRLTENLSIGSVKL